MTAARARTAGADLGEDASVPLDVLVDHLGRAAGDNPELRRVYSAFPAKSLGRVQCHRPGRIASRSWDVLHFNWPEWCVRRHGSPWVTAADYAALLAEIAVSRRRGAGVVWSAHNLVPHEIDRLGLTETFLSAFVRQVDLILATSQTVVDLLRAEHPALRAADHRIVPLVHHRGFYPDDGVTQIEARAKLGLPPDARIVLSFGLVRGYKNLPELLRCRRQLAGHDPDRLLLIAGRPTDASLAELVRREARAVPGVRLELRYIPEPEIQYFVRASDSLLVSSALSVNSGAAMLALSYDRPVVVPRRGTFLEMHEELGGQWVRTYEGGLRSSVLREAFDVQVPEGRPPLDPQHDPGEVARRTLSAFRHVVGTRRRFVPSRSDSRSRLSWELS